MAEVVVFHHMLGLTDGVRAFAETLRAAGHVVHAPDLYDGRTFTAFEDAAAFVSGADKPDFAALADAAVAELPSDLIYLGFSFGVMNAQRLAQTRPGARAAVLAEACIPVTGEWAFGPWPDGVPVQIHGMDDDEFFAHEGDLDAARELVDAVGADGVAELFVYAGSGHLFSDPASPGYDAAAADLFTARVLEFLARV